MEEPHDFPILCEPCLGDNPYMRMTKQPSGRECKICARPYTTYRWLPGAGQRYKKTEICPSCAKIKNVCQTCLLDLEYGLPTQVRDTVMGGEFQTPTSDVNRQWYLRNAEEKVIPLSTQIGDVSDSFVACQMEETGQGMIDYGKMDSVAKEALRKLARAEPYSRRNEPHICSFYVKGNCTRGKECPYRDAEELTEDDPRHEKPSANALGSQSIRNRYDGKNDPVAQRILANASRSPAVADAQPPSATAPPNVTSLFLTNVGAAVTQDDLMAAFSGFGQVKSAVISAKQKAAFINFAQRSDAESKAAPVSTLLPAPPPGAEGGHVYPSMNANAMESARDAERLASNPNTDALQKLQSIAEQCSAAAATVESHLERVPSHLEQALDTIGCTLWNASTQLKTGDQAQLNVMSQISTIGSLGTVLTGIRIALIKLVYLGAKLAQLQLDTGGSAQAAQDTATTASQYYQLLQSNRPRQADATDPDAKSAAVALKLVQAELAHRNIDAGAYKLFDKALVEADGTPSLVSMVTQRQIKLARHCLQAGDYERCSVICEKLTDRIDTMPDQPATIKVAEAHALRAISLLESGLRSEVESAIESIELCPDNASYHKLKIRLLMAAAESETIVMQDKLVEGVNLVIKRLLKHNARSDVLGDVVVLKVSLMMSSSDSQDAATLVQQVTQQLSEIQDAVGQLTLPVKEAVALVILNVAEAALSMKQDYNAALQYLTLIRTILQGTGDERNRAILNRKIALCHLNLGSPEMASSAVAGQDACYLDHYVQFMSNVQQGQPAQAMKSFRACIQQAPDAQAAINAAVSDALWSKNAEMARSIIRDYHTQLASEVLLSAIRNKQFAALSPNVQSKYGGCVASCHLLMAKHNVARARSSEDNNKKLCYDSALRHIQAFEDCRPSQPWRAVPYKFEASLAAGQTEELASMVEVLDQCEGVPVEAFERMADLTIRDQRCSSSIVLLVLQSVLDALLRRDALDYDKFSLWFRMLITTSLVQNKSVAMQYFAQVLEVVKTSHMDGYPAEEVAWLAVTAWNTSVDYYSARVLDEAKRWAELAQSFVPFLGIKETALRSEVWTDGAHDGCCLALTHFQMQQGYDAILRSC
ncbi:Pre-mRNA-splicing factor slt11 [Sorochytrium milnesiophthora]